MACIALALTAMATVLLTACGGGSDSSQTTSTATATTAGSPSLDPTAPITKQLAAVFPVPKAPPGSPSTVTTAIEAGRKACRGKTPLQVREEFIDSAQGLSKDQEKMIAQLQKFESQASTSPDFAAGQLAAGVYEATLPESQKVAGYQGCVYELALQLRRELAKKQG
jgi:predicted outer membrane protein